MEDHGVADEGQEAERVEPDAGGDGGHADSPGSQVQSGVAAVDVVVLRGDAAG